MINLIYFYITFKIVTWSLFSHSNAKIYAVTRIDSSTWLKYYFGVIEKRRTKWLGIYILIYESAFVTLQHPIGPGIL